MLQTKKSKKLWNTPITQTIKPNNSQFLYTAAQAAIKESM